MTRKKRNSRALENAELRAAGLKAIDPTMNVDDVRNIAYFTAQIDQLRSKIDGYNTALVEIDSFKTEIEILEKNLSDLSEQMLTAVAFKYGKESREYEMAGGVRKSERIRRSSMSRLKARPDSPSPRSTAQTS